MTIKIYETERLYVRPFTKEDMEGNYKLWWTDQEVTRYNAHGLFPYTKGQMEAFLARLESSSDIVWAVIAKYHPKKGQRLIKHDCQTRYFQDVDGLHIGNITLQNINWINRSCEFAVVMGEKEYWNKGYCTEAATLLFDHGFNKLNLNRIWTGTASTNMGMRKVAEKLGMAWEGTFGEATFLEGKYVDVIEYGLLKKEWNRIKGKE
ncbi:MAG: GNAT family N-acetyltransferase [Gammaproteobacteria bacterium]|nr:GNAT family N-acetyltransferase [Gammaproteobacteria bacterium]